MAILQTSINGSGFGGGGSGGGGDDDDENVGQGGLGFDYVALSRPGMAGEFGSAGVGVRFFDFAPASLAVSLDIAMGMLDSSLFQGLPPLDADAFAEDFASARDLLLEGSEVDEELGAVSAIYSARLPADACCHASHVLLIVPSGYNSHRGAFYISYDFRIRCSQPIRCMD